jgi:hypothetical protein
MADKRPDAEKLAPTVIAVATSNPWVWAVAGIALAVGGVWLWRKLFGRRQAPWTPVLSGLVDSSTLAAGTISAGWMPVLSTLVDSPTLLAGVISAGWTPVLAALMNSLVLSPTVITGSVQGVVYNRQNPQQVIAGATVRVLSGTTIIAETTSNQTGFFSIPNVPPGSYEAWCSATGFAQMSKPITVFALQTTSVAFDMAPLGTAIGFYMQVDFDPSSWPIAKYWYADINGTVWTWQDIQLNPTALWDESDVDMTDPIWASQTLTSELYDANYNLLVRRIVPLGGAAGPLVQNGRTYSFNMDQAHLYDMGPF